MATLILIYIGTHLLLWIPAALAAWTPSRAGTVFTSVRLSLFAAFLAIALPLSAASAPVIGPGGLIFRLVEIFLVAVLATDAIVWMIGSARNPTCRRLGLASAMLPFAVLVIGFGMGATVWSERLPGRLLASAADFAGERAYCIMNGPEVATTRRDLTAWSIWWRRGMVSPDIHSMLVIEDANGDRTFANWSFSRGRFVETTPAAFNVLDRAHVDCHPRHQFADQL